MHPQILYEDNHLLVVVKPPNVPSQADASGDADMLSICREYVRVRYNKPGAAYLGLVHRLDRPAGGVMVFARTSKAAARLSAQLADERMQKTYLCVCTRAPAQGLSAAPLTHWLRKDAHTNTVYAHEQPLPAAKEARLFFEPLQYRHDLCLCRVALYTGRPHQIRVQFQAMGHPLWGDARYNPQAQPGQQLALWSAALALAHPTRGEPLRFTNLPGGGVWQRFAVSDAIVQ